MRNEEDYLLLSQLTHAGYCLRRAWLVMNEQVWKESADTAKGRADHNRVHNSRIERRGSEIKMYELEVSSARLELRGKCDCIELSAADDGCMVPGIEFPVKLFPVEFKHGKVRDEEEYNIQLCAQAICLEEMFHTSIQEGAVFYTSSHRRYSVAFDEALRKRVFETTQILRNLRNGYTIPAAQFSAKCTKCSLKDYCMPALERSAAKYCKKLAEDAKRVDVL